jgi:hypothetical protein
MIARIDALVAATPGQLDDLAWIGARLAAGTVLIAVRAARYLITMRRAFPWPLRCLLVIAAVQIPVLPTDEIAAIIAAVWIAKRYRPTLRVAYRAAQLDTIETI